MLNGGKRGRAATVGTLPRRPPYPRGSRCSWLGALGRGVLSLVLLACFHPSMKLAAASSHQVVLHPTAHVTAKGSHSDQDVEVLGVKGLPCTGTNDCWDDYREVDPDGKNRYVGYFYFDVPPVSEIRSVESIVFGAHVRGQHSGQQLWKFQVRNFDTGKWELLADNKGVTSWEWSDMEGNMADLNFRHYQASYEGIERIEVRLWSKNNVDVLNVDFLELILSGTEGSPLQCGTPCEADDDCYGDGTTSGAYADCESVYCDVERGLCSFNAWQEVDDCGTAYKWCDGNDSYCDKGPAGSVGACLGWTNNECVYEYCSGGGEADPPTKAPTDAPTKASTDPPTKAPTDPPTKAPTDAPTKASTDPPTKAPTDAPTKASTDPPTKAPTDAPTKASTDPPTKAPTDPPTKAPTDAPTKASTDPPTKAPTDAPTKASTDPPTKAPTDPPTKASTDAPSKAPTDAPTKASTDPPTKAPTDAPTKAPTDPSSGMKVMVPVYFYPDTSGTCTEESTCTCTDDDYAKLAAAGPSVASIINPNSGPVPPDSTETNYYAHKVCTDALGDGGNEVFGYVKTKDAVEDPPGSGTWIQQGFRPLSEIVADLNMYRDFYNVDGIFLDEVSNIWQVTENSDWGDHVAFYQSVFSDVASVDASWKIVINPGSPFPTEFFDTEPTADVAVVFEGAASGWDPTPEETCLEKLWTQDQGEFGPGPWYVPNWDGVDTLVAGIEAGTYEGKEASALIYAAGDTSSTVQEEVNLAHEHNVAYVYVTERPQASPWSSLPEDWNDLLQAVQNVNGSSSPTPAPTSTSPWPSNPRCVWNQAYIENENYDSDSYADILGGADGCYVLVDPFDGEFVINTEAKISAIKSNGNAVGCYISSGTCEGWRSDFGSISAFCVDEPWEQWNDEYFVYDIDGILPFMKARIDSMAGWGCDYVEFDNMDWCTDSDYRSEYGSTPGQEFPLAPECASYNQDLCDYAHDKSLLCMAKNTGYLSNAGDRETDWAAGDLMDAITFESYRSDFNWWSDEHLQGFLDNMKPVVVVHYNAGSNPSANTCDYVLQEYETRYNTDEISFICESNPDDGYVHFL